LTGTIERFFGAASMMRRILVNHAETKRAQKRGGGVEKTTLDEVAVVFDNDIVDRSLSTRCWAVWKRSTNSRVVGRAQILAG
jgi:hypothetical protein